MHKKKYTVVLAVCLSFYFSCAKCYLVLFLYYQLIVHSSLAFVLFKRSDYQCTLPLCKVMCKWKQTYVRSDCSELLFIACHMYKLN